MLAGLCFVLDHGPFAGNVIHRHLTANVRAVDGSLPTVLLQHRVFRVGTTSAHRFEDSRFGRLNIVVQDFNNLLLETTGDCWGNECAKFVKMSRRSYPLKVEEFDPGVEDNIPPPHCSFNVLDVYYCKHRFLWCIGRFGVEILH
ncbi:unnamed protein product [Taenia asiatica]|uniref:Secreted protein n=1 Tax=Taenia asiatica TaxID=60517 RepID=A0A0R3WG85_TAEAS|nr:unnamed protein product [Taenia asiatica]